MKVKVFTLNANGKIEFTPNELQALLDEVANENTYHPIVPYYNNYRDNINTSTASNDREPYNIKTTN